MLKQYGGTLPSLVASIKKMERLEARTKRPYADLLKEYEATVARLSKAAESLEALEKRRDGLSKEIRHLEKLSGLQDFLDANEASEEGIAELIDEKDRLKRAGYDTGAIRLVSEELARLGGDTRELAKLIERWAPKARTLEQALALARQRIAEAEKEEALAQGRLDSLNAQAAEVKAGIRALEDHLASQSRNLESEYETRRRVLDSKMHEERTRREAETMELLKLRDKAAKAVQALKEEEAAIKSKLSKDEEKGPD